MILRQAMNERQPRKRKGAVLPLITVCVVGLMSFVALAIDIGLMMVSRNQCQNAADIAALTGARTLTGDPATNYNQSNAVPNAKMAAEWNNVLGVKITDPQVTVSIGKYYYNRTTARFVAYPSDPGSVDSPTDPPSLVQATVTAQPPTYFATIFGMNSLNVGATSTAAHRPRDIAMIIDFSGSMRLDSQLATPLTYVDGSGNYQIATRTDARSTDPNFPQFGPYSNVLGFGLGNAITSPTSFQTDSGEFVGFSNLTSPGVGGNPAIVDDFFQDSKPFGTSQNAFTAAPAAYATVPDGDQYPVIKTTSYAARNYNEVMGNKYYQFTDKGGFALSRSFDGGIDGSGGSTVVTSSNVWKFPLNSSPWRAYYGRMQFGSGHVPDLSTFVANPPVPYVGWVKVPAGQGGNNTASPADRTVAMDTNFETNGYNGFKGYTTGPGYWGKTFFMWPPDPRGPSTPGDVSATNNAKDWRQRFFVMEFQPLTVPNVPGTPGPPPPPSGGGGGGGGGSPPPSGGGGGGSPPPPPPPPSPLAFTAVGGLVHNNVLWYSDGTMKMPGDITTLPSRYRRTAGSYGSAYTATTNYDKDPNNNGGSPAQTFFPQVPYGQYRYRINYDAVLHWLKSTGTNPFPPVLRAGGILYYSSIPDTIPNPNGNMPTSDQPSRDARFWKEYIDYVFGLQQYSDDSWADIMAYTGYGDDNVPDSIAPTSTNPFPLTSPNGGVFISSKPTTQTFTTRRYNYVNGVYQLQSVSNFTLQDTRYMDYRDNPRRPVTKYWFGPLTMVDFLGNFNTQQFWWPGTSHEAPMWQLKSGVQTALGYTRNNHPNDYLSVIGFSVPLWTGNTSTGYYNAVRAPLSQDYKRMINSLWFPKYVVDNQVEISPYDYDTISNASIPGAMASVPRSVQGTCSPYSMMLAYNQFSNNQSSLTFAGSGATDFGMAGGLGRLGAKKVIVFETDGVASALATDPSGAGVTGPLFAAGSTNVNGTNTSYFKVRWTDNGTPELPDYVYGPASASVNQTKSMADLITNRTDGYDPIAGTSGSGPGFATPRSAVAIHTIAFGSLFNTSNTSPAQSQALGLLQYMQYRGGTQADPNSPLDSTKIINQPVWDDGLNNPATSRKAAMKKAFTESIQDPVGVVLIR